MQPMPYVLTPLILVTSAYDLGGLDQAIATEFCLSVIGNVNLLPSGGARSLSLRNVRHWIRGRRVCVSSGFQRWLRMHRLPRDGACSRFYEYV